jgi:hypothetical protein
VTDAGPPNTTVVIPVWDRYVGARLLAAINSVRAQDRLVRLIVVDNASTVPLPALPQDELLSLDRRLTAGAARNAGLELVQTPYVMLWDADDVMEPGTVGFLEDQLAASPQLVAFGAAIIEEPSGVRHRWPRPWVTRLLPHRRLFALVDAVWSMFPTTGAALMRTEVVKACRGYAEADSGDDWCLGAALAWRGGFGWSERPGRRYLQHEGSLLDTNGTWRHQLAHAAAVRTRLALPGIAPEWIRRILPLVALAQWSAVGAHFLAGQLRAARRRPAGDDAA